MNERPEADAGANPLLKPFDGPFGLPPFSTIRPEHYGPGFEAGMAAHRAEIEAIAGARDAPSFANTVIALENAGRSLSRVNDVFWNLASAHTDEAMQAVEREIAPKLDRHYSAIGMNAALFARLDDLYARRESLELEAEPRRLLERLHLDMVRGGARLAEPEKERLGAIGERLAELGTAFTQNVLADENAFVLVLEGEDDLAGLPGFLRDATARAASDRGLAGKHVVTLARPLIEPFLTFSSRSDLREAAFAAFARRGENAGASDNRPVIAEILALRAERAALLGYPDFATFKLEDTMARRPDAVRTLLEDVWKPAVVRAREEADAIEAAAAREGHNGAVGRADWRYFSEKVRRATHEFDESVVKPYFELGRMIDAAFWVAERLFGVTFAPVATDALYHPDVRAFEARDRDGRHVGLFLGDYFARPGKRSGAWMSSFRNQEKLGGEIRPIIVNVLNVSKAPDGQPVLLGVDDVRTLFHEFGHGLHGLLSNVTYPRLSGTSVERDFVELPSQLYEHWALRPEVLSRFALHAETGEPMPADLVRRVIDARNYGQGFSTSEYLSSAIADLDLHEGAQPDSLDVDAFEDELLERLSMPEGVGLRHRLPHFQHIFSGDGYSAGYYSYLWSEVLDADAFKAFQEMNDAFHPAVAKRLHDYVYAAGGTRSAEEAWSGFRGRMPEVDALLEKRGLA